ncbi:DNRLRE domain-containing protein [Streptomyces sp. NBC_01142]|uniref:LamG-like jellyroll fold domain-containing protein n=1 Tax=Streptomyces sp. NBC_01142 TaxID=2975865 RepID=UPI0022533118|nr:LamG-like jellyroll fold domain-containing protein [Streptomyces sp. NBC_01142]MCX4819013.1 DNRLRE domain-containing protein [Streptomyces sp. NBC_01142]
MAWRWRRWGATRGVAMAAGSLLTLGGLTGGLLPGVAAAAESGVGPAAVRAASGGASGSVSESAALAEAKRSGKAVEVTSLRRESSEVFATPGGELEAREYLRPVWARVQGQWKPVDTELAKTSGGMVAPKVATLGLEFSGGGDRPLVRMARAGRELALSWPGPLPAPELDEETATYRDVLPDVDLRMGAQEDGFTQLLVVKSAEAAESSQLAELRLKLRADGLNVRETAAGGLEAVDEGAKGAVFEAPRPMMWDSSPGEGAAPQKAPQLRAAARGDSAGDSGDGGERGAGESGKLAPVGVELPVKGDELVLRPDQQVLKGKNTQYPVFIDPQWYSPRAAAWTMASKYWASAPQWKFNGASDSGLGYCNWTYCAPHDTKRLFYRIPTSKFAGKSILSAEFVVRNTWSASCSARGVQLWRTEDISDSTTWNSQNRSGFWIKQLKSESFAHGFNGCAAKDAEFDVKSAVQEAANGRKPTMTFGLRAASESDGYGWKRFSDKAYLRVKYNRPPSQIRMSQLSMEYGGMCKQPANAARVRTLGRISANNVTDPDGDSVAVQFQATWDAGDGKGNIVRWSPSLTSSKQSGRSFSIGLPAVPQNKQVAWYARSYDGAQYSPWSTAGDPTGCYFTYDTTVPKGPAITSGDYPASDPENPEDPWLDGVGKYGAFALKAADSDVTKYWYGINGDPSSKNVVVTTGGAAKTVQVLPSKPGLNFVTAQAFDAHGNGSEVRTYQYRVKAGQPEKAAWTLDDAAGATEAQGTGGVRVADLHGGATPGVEGAVGTAVSFDGVDDYVRTDIPTVATETGFSAAAWVKLSKMPDTEAVIAAQPGNHSPSFELSYSKSYDRWVFNQFTADSPGAGAVHAMSATPGGVKAGEWTHLVGTFSSGSKELKLYVQGKLVGTTTYSTPWDARRGLQIGAGSYSGRPGSFFPGSIDEVRIYDKPLSDADVASLHNKQPIGMGRPARAVFPMDEPADATQITGRADVHPAVLKGGAIPGRPGVAGKALTLDGNDDYATAGAPHLNNQRSFTVSAWAKLPKTKPDHAAIVATQAGIHKSGFELYYSSAYDRWVFNQFVSDTSDSTAIRAMQADGKTAYGGDWVHLVGVHDTVANQLTLYVNGVEAGRSGVANTWYAGGPVQIGAGSYEGKPGSFFPGQIDDVKLFDRPVSAGEVQQLFQQRPSVRSRWMFEETTGTDPVTTADAAGTGNALVLKGGAAKSDSEFIDSGALQLNGVDGYAGTSTVPVDTSGSFTLTAWAQAAAMPEGAVALAGAEGSQRSAFSVRFVPAATDPNRNPGRWELSVADKDAGDATVVQVGNGELYDATEWNHLALVYDGFTKQARLYVNGALAEVGCKDDDGDGQGDDPACTDLVPWAEDALAFKAASLQVGRSGSGSRAGEYFPGLVDDVWIFQGALTDGQVEKLSISWFDVPTQVPGD